MEEVSDIVIFLGRFHPLLVHFPIGILSLAIVLEIISYRAHAEKYKPVLILIWLLGAMSAVLSAGLGYLLSHGGGYNEDTVALHRWSGICLSVIAFVCYFLKKNEKESSALSIRYSYSILVVFASLLLIFTGHLGGSLTHGSEYMVEFAPNTVQELLGRSPENIQKRRKVTSLDSADVFDDAIMPIINSKCISCHNRDKSKGELILTSFEEMMEGGEDGPVIIPGSLASSEIYRRITLPADHKEFMPSEGKKPLSADQLAIIEWWIESKAPRSGTITSLAPDKKMVELFEKFYGLGNNSAALLTAPLADTAIVNRLIRQGFMIRRLAVTSNLLEGKLSEGASQNVEMESLLGLKDQLVWLQLSNSGISDKELEIIGGLSNLRKLNISRNNISDKGVINLLGLSNLEYLNLYETNVTDSSIVPLMALPQLKELYLWQTKVSSKYVDKLKSIKPNLKIVYKTP